MSSTNKHELGYQRKMVFCILQHGQVLIIYKFLDLETPPNTDKFTLLSQKKVYKWFVSVLLMLISLLAALVALLPNKFQFSLARIVFVKSVLPGKEISLKTQS